MLSATVNATKSAQNYPKLPKTAKFCQILPKDKTLKYYQKLRFYCFSKKEKFLHVENALEHVSTNWIFNPRIFHMLFLFLKTALVCKIQHTPLWKLMIFSRFHTLCGHEIL
jgi:hypothetical protein